MPTNRISRSIVGGEMAAMARQSASSTGFRSARTRNFRARHFPWLRRALGQQGTAMVEMAFASVILLTMLFGVMEMCLALYTYHFISEAAREGTRYAIVRGSSCANPPMTPCPASPDDIQSYVETLGFPGIDPAAMTVSTTYSAYPAGGVCAPSASCNNPGNQVQVTVNYQYPLSIPFIPSSTLNMSSTSQMVISQ